MSVIPPVASIDELGGPVGSRTAMHLDRVFRTFLRGEGVVSNDRYHRLISGEMHPFGNLAIVADASGLDSAVEACEPLCAEPLPSAVIFPTVEHVHASVDSSLQERGFHAAGMPAMAIDIDTLADTTLPEGYQFERVGSGDQAVDEWTNALAIGYEIPLPLAKRFSPLVIPAEDAHEAPIQFFAVRDSAGAVVATSLFVLHDGLAGIYCVATIPDERGKGLGAHATAEALRIAQRIGYGVGVLQSSEIGHSVYRRLGFLDFGTLPMYIRIPG